MEEIHVVHYQITHMETIEMISVPKNIYSTDKFTFYTEKRYRLLLEELSHLKKNILYDLIRYYLHYLCVDIF